MKSTLKILLLTFFVLLAPLVDAGEIKGPAPDFKLEDTKKKQTTIKDFKGQVVLLNFWASWCGPCRQEMPLLEEIHQKYKKLGFSVVGINIDEDTKMAFEQLKKTPVSFPVLLDPKNKISELYKVDAMPSTFMIDRKGNMRFLHRGYKPGYEVEYVDQIKKLIRER